MTKLIEHKETFWEEKHAVLVINISQEGEDFPRDYILRSDRITNRISKFSTREEPTRNPFIAPYRNRYLKKKDPSQYYIEAETLLITWKSFYKGISSKNIEKLENKYTFVNPTEINEYLKENDFLLDILNEAPEHIHRIFGQVPIYLEVHTDPEEGWAELFIVIKSPHNPQEAVQLKNKLMNEWFIKKMKDAKGKLNITEEPL